MTESETAQIIADALTELGTDTQDIEFSAGFIADRITAGHKLEAFDFGMQLFGIVLVAFDPRVEGVEIPEYLRSAPKQTFRYGVNLAPAIRDLSADGNGITGTLSFSGQPYQTFVPWDAVFAMRPETGEQMLGLWHDSVPAELRPDLEPPPEPFKEKEPAGIEKKQSRAHLSLVPEEN